MIEMNMKQAACSVIQQLHRHGYEAYFVGGCVRDELLGRPVKDFDIATAALPEQVMGCFEKVIPTGLQHGTVTILAEGFAFEVTTFRKESEYEQFRRPKEVCYITDLNEDLRRRDFTMNAMAIGLDGRIIDPFGGQEDLAKGLLRCVGQPDERYREDALRMLRAIRFASTYALRIEECSWQALLSAAPLLHHIAMERVRTELERMVAGPAPEHAVDLLLKSGLWEHFKDPLHVSLNMLGEDPAKMLLPVLDELPDLQDRWTLLFLLAGAKAKEASRAMRSLTFSNQDLFTVKNILASAETLANEIVSERKGSMESCTSEKLWKLTAVRQSGISLFSLARIVTTVYPRFYAKPGRKTESLQAGTPFYALLHILGEDIWKNGIRWLEQIPCKEVKALAITGRDLMKHFDQKGGPWLKTLLQCLLEKVALNVLPNDREKLLEEAERYMMNWNKERKAHD